MKLHDGSEFITLFIGAYSKSEFSPFDMNDGNFAGFENPYHPFSYLRLLLTESLNPKSSYFWYRYE